MPYIAPCDIKVANKEFVEYLNDFAYSFKYHSTNLTNTQYAMISDLIEITDGILRNNVEIIDK